MKKILVALSLILSATTYSNTCIELAEKKLLEKVSSKLSISPQDLKIRYIGGESLDGDYTSDGLYQDNAWEYFDVFLKDEVPKNDEALVMFLVEVSKYSNEATGQVECEMNSVQSIDNDDWSSIYRTYL